jgi:hypothetical protein
MLSRIHCITLYRAEPCIRAYLQSLLGPGDIDRVLDPDNSQILQRNVTAYLRERREEILLSQGLSLLLFDALSLVDRHLGPRSNI